MDTEKALKLAEKALETLTKTNPFLGPVTWALFYSVRDTETAIDTGEISKLETEARRQELSLHMAKMQAQVAQELAIAHRIENALEGILRRYRQRWCWHLHRWCIGIVLPWR
ncbi:hypothetical protein [Aeromonas enteropelogenes]|uniref:hypothetical protein n=1 Tax=Aeromonas enteropelogenes TaxID=29489 RepID=UPI003B9E2CC8